MHKNKLCLDKAFICKVLFLVAVLAIIFSVSSVAEAAGPFGNVRSGKNIVDMTEFGQRIKDAWSLLRHIALYIGAVALAALAVRALLGSEKEMEQMKKAGLWIIFAVFALAILPSVVNLGMEIGQTNGWSPPQSTASEVTGTSGKTGGSGASSTDEKTAPSTESSGESKAVSGYSSGSDNAKFHSPRSYELDPNDKAQNNKEPGS